MTLVINLEQIPLALIFLHILFSIFGFNVEREINSVSETDQSDSSIYSQVSMTHYIKMNS